jgi:hypothetical protein
MIFPGLRRWLTMAALAAKSEAALLDGFCRCAFDATSHPEAREGM